MLSGKLSVRLEYKFTYINSMEYMPDAYAQLPHLNFGSATKKERK